MLRKIAFVGICVMCVVSLGCASKAPQQAALCGKSGYCFDDDDVGAVPPPVRRDPKAQRAPVRPAPATPAQGTLNPDLVRALKPKTPSIDARRAPLAVSLEQCQSHPQIADKKLRASCKKRMDGAGYKP